MPKRRHSRKFVFHPILIMNSRVLFYFFFLSSTALSLLFYSAYRNGYLSWKTNHTFVYLNFRSEITNSFGRTDDKSPRQPSKQNRHIDKSSFISDTPYAEYGNVSQCPPNIFKKNLTKLLETWSGIAERQNISWVLFYGSLLGVVRNSNIIPYDSDIDILIDARDVAKLRWLEHPRNFTIKDYQTRLVLVPDESEPVQERRHITCEGKEVPEMFDECSFTDPTGRLINGPLHIDLYAYYHKGDHIEDPSEKMLKRYHLEDFYPFRECRFLGIRCKCPQNPRKLLVQYFETNNLKPSKRCKNGIWI